MPPVFDARQRVSVIARRCHLQHFLRTHGFPDFLRTHGFPDFLRTHGFPE
jgi:hypothetical protein